MTELELAQHLHQAFNQFAAKPSGEVFLDMQRSGLIDANGELQQWDAFLAIVSTNATQSSRATHFRCRKPTLGLPGRAEIDISRESMLRYLDEGKRIITAVIDDETRALREGAQVHCINGEFLRTDRNSEKSDNLGDLPTFVGVRNRM